MTGFAYGGATASVMFTGQMRDRFGDGTASGLDYFVGSLMVSRIFVEIIITSVEIPLYTCAIDM